MRSDSRAERISIVTDEVSDDLRECRDFLVTHRLRAVEIRCARGRRFPFLDPRDLETLAGWARDRDPVILGVSPGLFKCDLADRSETRRHLEEILPRSIDLALELDARFLVSFSFENPAGRPIGPEAVTPLATAAEDCAAAGLPLLLENEPGFLACSATEIGDLLQAVGHENLYVNWDPANCDDLREASLADGLRSIFSRVRHVHVKNGRRHPGRRFPEYGPLGDGDIDWPAHLALLAELSYAGHLGLETHYEPRRESSEAVLGELRAMLLAVGLRRDAN